MYAIHPSNYLVADRLEPIQGNETLVRDNRTSWIPLEKDLSTLYYFLYHRELSCHLFGKELRLFPSLTTIITLWIYFIRELCICFNYRTNLRSGLSNMAQFNRFW